MRKFLVSFIFSNGFTHEIQVDAITAMLAVRNAHAKLSETVLSEKSKVRSRGSR
jgi:hypothetical protein